MRPALRNFLPLPFCLVLAAAVADDAGAPFSSKPLAPPSQRTGDTLFTTLPAQQTGISAPNLYKDPKMWAENYREFSLGAIGTGIAIGDYDNDGKPDVYVICKVGANHLFHNDGNFHFTDVTEAAGVGGPEDAWKGGVTWADVNNDGFLDLYVCRFNAPNQLFINQGNGTFKDEADERGVAVTDASNQATFCDYDRDGFLDFYLQTNVLDCEAHPNGQRDLLFHNNGDGTFTEVSDKAGIFGETQGHSALWWDYNEDGWPDLYVANDFKDPDQLYRNNGDGTFTNVLSRVLPHTPDSSMGSDFGDLNNDGHIDLLVADMAATSRYKDQQGMAKLRAGLPFNDDTPRNAPQYMRNALYLNTGSGRMMEGAILAGLNATDWTWTVRFEDLDNDGLLDAYFTNGTVRPFNYIDLLRKTNACESDVERIRLFKAAPPLAENNLAFRNLGDLHFENVSKSWGLDHFGVSFGGAFGDLDGDGDLDLVFASYDNEVTVCRNDSTSGHRLLVDLRGSRSNRFGTGARVTLTTDQGTQVRTLIPARGYMSSSEPAVHFGLGASNIVKTLTIDWPSGTKQVLDNLKVDQRLTVQEPQTGPAPRPAITSDAFASGRFSEVGEATHLDERSEESGASELRDQPFLTLRQNRNGPALLVLPGEEAPEVVLGGTAKSRTTFLTHATAGKYLATGSEITDTFSAAATSALVSFDANGDGKEDLLVTFGGNQPGAALEDYAPRLLLAQADGKYSLSRDAFPAQGLSAGVTAVADFDRDGQLDVFVGARQVPGSYPTSPRSALYRNEHGKFTDVTDSFAPGLATSGLVTAGLWVDVNGDGFLDLVLTYDWGPVTCWLNDGGKRLVEAPATLGFSTAGTGWWNSVAAADLNGDGRPDFILGNLGLNTPYQADAQHPASLYAGKFDATGKSGLVETMYEGATEFPFRSLQVLGGPFPWLNKRFPTFDSYGKADMAKVFGSDRIATLTRLQATNFQSGVLWSNKDGSYHFEPLPRLCQLAPLYGIAIADFDGDGHLDACVVQNSYAPIGEVGRFDGGVGFLLRGDGKGHLLPESPAASGFIVTGSGKSLVKLDLNRDGWPDLVAGRSHDTTLAFLNHPTDGHHAFALRLAGPVGNRTSLGATVTVSYEDGSSQSEILSTSEGYHSQSEPLAFFGYLDSNKPKSFKVLWPDGRSSEHAWTPNVPVITLQHPSL